MIDIIIWDIKWLLFNLYYSRDKLSNCWSVLCEISSNNLFSSGLSNINLTKTAKTAGGLAKGRF